MCPRSNICTPLEGLDPGNVLLCVRIRQHFDGVARWVESGDIGYIMASVPQLGDRC